MYLSEESGLGANKKWVHRRRGIAGSGSAPSGTAGLGHVGAPVLDVPCPDPPGCAPLAAGDCRRAVRDAVREAIRLATIAANKLDALVKMPVDMRDADGQRTAKLFTFFFGHDPLHPISWAGNQESGVSVAVRFRSVARELNGGRRVILQCLPSHAGCADTDLTCCDLTTNAFFSTGVPNTVNLCQGFWNPPAGLRGLPARNFRAAVIIHEMLHMLFEDLRDVGHGRARAACYEAFALRLAQFGADPFDVCQCKGTPCP